MNVMNRLFGKTNYFLSFCKEQGNIRVQNCGAMAYVDIYYNKI